MNSAKNIPSHRNADRRRLPVEWLEHSGASAFSLPIIRRSRRGEGGSLSQRAFTILELMIVVGIIGLMAGLALPHLKGFTTGSAMTAATRQMLDDVSFARQRAMANRSQVCMVFLPPNFWMNGLNLNYSNSQMTTLVGHQYAAYALIALRTVGDQPGRSNVHYLTDWRVLPQGVFIAPFQFTNFPGLTTLVSVTNTTMPQPAGSNGWYVSAFPTNIQFPFPSYNETTNYLPYIGFAPSGQLLSGADQFIMLTSGSTFYPLNANGVPQWNPSVPSAFPPIETPPGNEFNNANMIHIDWVTGRAKLERNQF